jgi:cytochrome c553
MKRPIHNLYKWLLGFLGCAFIYWGGKVLFVTKYYSGRYDIIMDHTYVRWPLGIMLVVLGMFIVYKSAREPRKIAANDTTSSKETAICTACHAPSADSDQEACPRCGGDLEPLDGFYERHPELRDRQ